MRVGWRVPLPGPFSVSGSMGGRPRGGSAAGCGCLPFLGLALLVGLADEYPWAAAAVGAVAAAAVAAVVIAKRRQG